jgi:hypothetical protein
MENHKFRSSRTREEDARVQMKWWQKALLRLLRPFTCEQCSDIRLGCDMYRLRDPKTKKIIGFAWLCPDCGRN